MEFQFSKRLVLRSGCALAMLLALGTPALSQSPEPAKAKRVAMEGKTHEHSQMMQEHCKEMMSEMKAQDAELTAQVARMNSASKDSKLDLMAEIITQMAQQRVAMNVRMGHMHMEMMKHVQMCMGPGSHHSMMKGADQQPKDANKDVK